MSTPKPEPITDTEAQAIVAKAETVLGVTLMDWQKVVVRGVLTGNSPVRIHRGRKTPQDSIHLVIAHIEEARAHGIA